MHAGSKRVFRLDCSFLAWILKREGLLNLAERHNDVSEKAEEVAAFTFNDVPEMLEVDLPPIILKPQSNMKS